MMAVVLFGTKRLRRLRRKFKYQIQYLRILIAEVRVSRQGEREARTPQHDAESVAEPTAFYGQEVVTRGSERAKQKTEGRKPPY